MATEQELMEKRRKLTGMAKSQRKQSGSSKNYDSRIDVIDRELKGVRNPISATTDGTTTETPGSNGFAVDAETAKRLFPSLGMSFDDWYGGNASGYQTRLGLADESLKKKLSTQGLLGSGREVELYQDEARKLDAEAQQTYMDNQQKDIDNFSNWYSTNQNLAQGERDSLRSSMLGLLNLASGQSNSASGVTATRDQANNALNQGARQGSYITSSAGGGGTSPLPSRSNDNSLGLTLSSILGKGQQGSSMWGDTLAGLFGGGNTTSSGNGGLFGVKF